LKIGKRFSGPGSEFKEDAEGLRSGLGSEDVLLEMFRTEFDHLEEIGKVRVGMFMEPPVWCKTI
jgi:hypothetical protein